jgi:hypothetical protein
MPPARLLAPAALCGFAFLLGCLAAVGQERLAGAIAAIAVVLALVFGRPRTAILVIVVYATLVGWLRRVVTHALDEGATADPLLAVIPLAAVALAAFAVRRGAARPLSPLTVGVLVLSVIAVAGAFNPAQGDLLVGLAGLLFFGAPLLWFWVGRGLVDELLLARLFALVVVLGVMTAVYGLAQSAGWFPSYDQAWVDSVDLASLRVADTVRPFGLLSSPAEYSRYLAFAIVILVAYGRLLRPKVSGRLASAALLGLLGLALLLSAVRTSAVLTVLAVAVVVALRHRARVPGLLLVVGTAFALLVVGATVSGGERFDDDGVARLAQRQLGGLSSPLDEQNSTAEVHVAMVGRAVAEGFTRPFGSGTGVPTPAASRFGDEIRSADADVGNVALAWGVIGLAAFLFVLVAGLWRAYRLARRDETWLSLAAVGLLVVALFQWMNGGLYALAPIVWITLGWVDRRLVTAPEPEREPAAVAAP